MSALKLGSFRLSALSDGCFRLDGGSMFGVVPRVLWEGLKPPDERNRIHLGLNCLLAEGEGGRILVEAGLGGKLTPKQEDLYGLERTDHLLSALEGRGLKPEDIDMVILSHLHLDHCGWSTRADGGDRFIPTFPKARYLVQEKEWEAAVSPDIRSRASYDRRHFAALLDEGRLELVSGDAEVAPGVRVRLTGGHTPGHQVVVLESGEERCLFLGDLVPTFAHLRVTWHMGWDLFPLELMRVKEEVLKEAQERGDLLFFTHEDSTPFARLDEKGELRPLGPDADSAAALG
jgi:glyoxylase-like metal-dependent hydrolase (beta-lactamase superfamily II)